MAHPANEKTPLLSPVDVQVERVPGPPLDGVFGAIPIVTDETSVGTGSPAASSTVTFGCVVNAVPPVAPAGWVEKASFVAGPEMPLTAMPTIGLLSAMPPVEPP